MRLAPGQRRPQSPEGRDGHRQAAGASEKKRAKRTATRRLVQTTLESTPDGATRRWTNQQTGNSGEVMPLRTYVSEAGSFCRDYREALSITGDTGRFYHTACRDDSARWVWLLDEPLGVAVASDKY
jgi:surface antigen